MLTLLALSLLAAPGATRDVRLFVRDRLDRPVADVTACRPAGSACEPIPLRRAGDDWLGAVSRGEAHLRLTAPGFEPGDVTVAGNVDLPRIRLRAKGSVTIRLRASDAAEKRALPIVVAIRAADREQPLDERKLVLPATPEELVVVFADVPAGAFILSWSGPEVARGEKPVPRVTTEAVDAGSAAALRGVLVEGTVHDDAGVAVGEAAVSLVDPGRPDGPRLLASSAADGRFALPGAPLGVSLEWRAERKSHVTARGTWRGEARLPIVLERAVRVVGRVVDESKAPVKATLVLESRDAPVEARARDVETDAEGRFSFHRTEPERNQLSVRAPGFRTVDVNLDDVRLDGKVADLHEIVLTKGRSIHGRVVDAQTSQPVPGALLKARRPPREFDDVAKIRVSSALSAEDGTFRIHGLPEDERIELSVEKPGYARTRREVVGDEIEIALTRGGRIQGTLCADPNEIATTRVFCDVEGQPGSGPAVAPDAAGRFVCEGLQAGTYLVGRAHVLPDLASAGGGEMRAAGNETAVKVEDEKTTAVRLSCDWIPVSGVALVDGKPLSRWFLSVRREDFSDLLVTDREGRFSVHVPAAGPYTFSSWVAGATGDAVPAGTSVVGEPSCDVPSEGIPNCVAAFTLVKNE